MGIYVSPDILSFSGNGRTLTHFAHYHCFFVLRKLFYRISNISALRGNEGKSRFGLGI